MLVALGAGCSAVNELLQLAARIERAGYANVETFHSFGTGSSNEVTVDASVGRGEPAPAGNQEIAEIVWTTYPRRFELLSITLDGDRELFERGELTALFGARDPSLDEREFSDDLTAGIRTAGIVFGLLVVVAVVVIVLLVRRSRRRRAQRWPGMPPPAPAGYATYGHGHGPQGPQGSFPPPPAAPPPGHWPPPPPGGIPPAPGAPPPPPTPPPSAVPTPGSDWPPPPPGGPLG